MILKFKYIKHLLFFHIKLINDIFYTNNLSLLSFILNLVISFILRL